MAVFVDEIKADTAIAIAQNGQITARFWDLPQVKGLN